MNFTPDAIPPESTWLTGSGYPAADQGVVGDYYYQTDLRQTWQKVQVDALSPAVWTLLTDDPLGPPGRDGADGKPGPQGVPGPAGTSGAAGTSGGQFAEGRLTLTTNVPVTTSDVTAAGTLYFTPYRGDRVRIYTGAAWEVLTFTEKSLSLSISSGTLYYVYLTYSLGTLSLVTSTTAYTTQDNVRVQVGNPQSLFLGWIYGSASNQTEDSRANRYVVNWYNPVRRSLLKTPAYSDDNAVTSYTESSTTWTPVNGGTNASANFISNGVDAGYWCAQAQADPTDSTAIALFGVGIDSTTTAKNVVNNGAGVRTSGSAGWDEILSEGKHTAYLLGCRVNFNMTVYADLGRLGGSADCLGTYLHGHIMG